MNLGLGGRIALVSGASMGIGKAIARVLAREGASVALSSRDRKRALAAAKDIAGRTGAKVLAHAVDVEKSAACAQWVRDVEQALGATDILVVNAGGPPEGDFGDLADGDWDEAFHRSFMSAVRLSRAVMPSMRRRKWGRILFIASISAKQPIAGLATSNAMRAGVLGLSKTLSEELGPDNVCVNVLLPGYTATERLEDLASSVARRQGVPVPRVYEGWAQAVPLRRIARPEEIAEAAAFLVSERASYITGAVLQVDGGRVSSPF